MADVSDNRTSSGAPQQTGRTSPATFYRQVVAELRKVVTPTRKELFSYTGVVLVFVVIMMALVYGLDFVFSLLVNFLFGDPTLGNG